MELFSFVEGRPVARFIKAELRKRSISYAGKGIPQGGCVGTLPPVQRCEFRLCMGCGDRLHGNERAEETGRAILADEFDLEDMLCMDDVRILDLFGPIVSRREATSKCVLANRALCQEVRNRGFIRA